MNYGGLDNMISDNAASIQTGILVIVALLLVWTIMSKQSEGMGLPSPALGLGTSNVMGFYQGFDQLHGPGSSSYSASDKAYAKILREDSGRDIAQ